MKKSTEKKILLHVFSALASSGLALSAVSVSAAPIVVTAPVTEDMPAATEGIAANITGGVGNIVVGTANAADETRPLIGEGGILYRVTGSWLGSDDVKSLTLTGGTATIYSGTMGDTTGAFITLKHGGTAVIANASTVVHEGDIDQSTYGGIFGGLSSVNAVGMADRAEAYVSNSSVAIHGGDIGARAAGGISYANSTTGTSRVVASAVKKQRVGRWWNNQWDGDLRRSWICLFDDWLRDSNRNC